MEQFHVGGFEAARKLAQLLCPSQGPYVLDVGSGLGGPPRYLAGTRPPLNSATAECRPTRAEKQEKLSSKELRRLTKNLRKVNRNEQRPASTSSSVLIQRLRWSSTLAQG